MDVCLELLKIVKKDTETAAKVVEGRGDLGVGLHGDDCDDGVEGKPPSALSLAAKEGHSSVVRLLIEYGATAKASMTPQEARVTYRLYHLFTLLHIIKNRNKMLFLCFLH